jgi:hypothetical protein
VHDGARKIGSRVARFEHGFVSSDEAGILTRAIQKDLRVCQSSDEP